MNLNEFLFNLVVLWLGSELEHYCVYFEHFHIEAFLVYFSGFSVSCDHLSVFIEWQWCLED